MDNGDEKSASSAEARLKKGIAQGSISVRTKKHTIKSTPIKIKPHFFKHQADELHVLASPFTAKLLIENEGHEDVEDYNILIYEYGAEASREGTPNSDICKSGDFQALKLEDEEDEHGESGSLLAAGVISLESDNESGGGIVKKSGNSSDEGLSSASSLQRGKVSSEAVYVRTEVDYRTGGISLAVSKLRPDTYLGRQQGAHITAYAVFIISILESVDEQSIHEIPELLAVIAKKFISEERWAVLDAKIQEISHNIPQHFDQKRRKVITRDLKHVSIFSKETVEEIKLSLKVRQATYLAQLINRISQEVLEGINQNRHRLYQRPQKKSKQDLGQEGAIIKKALKCLRAMQHLIKWKLSNKKVTEIPEILKKGSVRQGLKVYLRKEKPSAKEVNAFLQSVKTGSISGEKLQAISITIGRLMFDLFDLDYFEYKASLILDEIPNKAKRIVFEQLISTRGTEHAVLMFEDQAKKSTTEGMNLAEINNEIIRNSVKIIFQHFDIVMRHAFFMLDKLPLENKQIILVEFLNQVQINMRWPKEIMEEIVPIIIEMVLNKDEVIEDLAINRSFGGGK